MRLCRIAIRNFRCIENIEIRPLDYTTLIGPNNAGKSSVLRAIEIFLNQAVPELDEWRKGHETEPIEIEAEFDSLLQWERNTPGVSGLVHGQHIKLRLRVLPPDPTASRKKPELTYECMKAGGLTTLAMCHDHPRL
jgi:putative ATP-dependent endonuclease of OLD family